MKAFELEDQYAIIFGLALWPQEPHEIDFYQQSLVFIKRVRQKRTHKYQIWDEIGHSSVAFLDNAEIL